MKNFWILCLCYVATDFHIAYGQECTGSQAGQPRCVGPLSLRRCGKACDDACSTEFTLSNFPPSGCTLGSGGCGSTDMCVTPEVQMTSVSLMFSDDPLEEDPCCEESSSALCFSGEATAVVENKGKTPLKEIRIGDKVLTGSGAFKTVYSINHKNPHKRTKFLQIYSEEKDSPLELTEHHMVFVEGKKNPIPAFDIKVGDDIKTMDSNGNATSHSIVTKISSITRDGLWNPLTTDGTIVVDGIITSTYSLTFGGEDIMVAGFKMMSHHDFIHLLMSPYRAMCIGVSLSLCESREEYNSYSKLGIALLGFGQKQSEFVQGIMLLMLIGTSFLFSFLIKHWGLISILGLACYFWSCYKKSSGKFIG